MPPFRIDRCHHRNKFSFVFVQQAALWSNKLLITPFRRRPFPCITILPSLNALARSTSASRHSEAIHVCVLHQESSPNVEGVHIFSTTTVACTMLVNGWESHEVNFTWWSEPANKISIACMIIAHSPYLIYNGTSLICSLSTVGEKFPRVVWLVARSIGEWE